MTGEAIEVHMAEVAREMRRRSKHGLFDGRPDRRAERYLSACRRLDFRTGAVLLFTRDGGHHSSGWMKNPDYERCWHLSLSPLPPGASRIWMPRAGEEQLAELDKKVSCAWVKAFYGEDLRYVWEESPKSPEGRACNVWHYRVFCNEAWEPIVPRGEVYSTELTELGWRSASQVFEEEGRVIESPVDPS